MNKYIHLIGIGGVGMSGIAQILLSQGKKISGSDIKDSLTTQKLSGLGAKVYIGHSQRYIGRDVELAVYSSAIGNDNPELQEAVRLKIPVLKRAEYLARLMQDSKNILVTGAHGKTTTVSLISHIMLKNNLHPTVVIGGILRNLGDNAYLGKGRYFVAEADESDGSFSYYKPTYAVITNIDYEHIDFFKNWQGIIGAFKNFIEKTDSKGCLFGCGDDRKIRRLFKQSLRRHIFFGLSSKNHLYPQKIQLNQFGSQFNCIYKNKSLGKINLPLTGTHNITNCLASVGLGLELGLEFKSISKTILSYRGVKRRFEIKTKSKDIMIIDDYAHHPTEIINTLKAAKRIKARRLLVIFQPHRFSRVRCLFDKFSRSLLQADLLIITDIYSAGEKEIKGVNANKLCERIKHIKKRGVHYIARQKLTDSVLKFIRAGDLVLFLGAGDISKVSNELTERIKSKDKIF